MRKCVCLLLLVLTACQVVEYRHVQERFNQAVLADNQSQTQPFVDGRLEYRALLEDMTPEYIAALDRRLQANAWMIRGVAAWRSGALGEARRSSEAGLALNPPAHSRDATVLRMLPGLVYMAEALQLWREKPEARESRYPLVFKSMSAAWRTLSGAERSLQELSPPSTRQYLYFQQWRLLNTWAAMVGDLAGARVDQRGELLQAIKEETGLGKFPAEEARDIKNRMKGPLRDLAESLSR